MSNPEFVKGACRRCGGHIEFPAAAAGSTVPCPHCGQPTALAPTGPLPVQAPDRAVTSRRAWLGVTVAVLVAAASVTAAFLWKQRARPNVAAPGVVSAAKPPASPEPTNAPVTTNVPVVAPVVPPPRIEAQTNDFAILPFGLEQTPGSSLVYVTGTVRNLSDQQRFGVKVEFGLFDANDTPVGSATDYQSVLDPHAEWHFRALVMASKTVSARFRAIGEAP
jgi:hypothetical protein